MHRVSWEEVDGDPTLTISTVSCVRGEARISLPSFSHSVVSILSLSLSRSLRLSFWKPSSLAVSPTVRTSVQPAHQPTRRPSPSLIRRKRSIHHGRLRVPTFPERRSWAFQNCGYRPSTSLLVILSPSDDIIWYIHKSSFYCFQKESVFLLSDFRI